MLLADEAAEGHLAFEIVGLLSLPALVLLNGLFVAAEFALVAIRRTRVEELIAQGVVRARAVQNALDKLDRSIAATQLGITLSSIALGWFSEQAVADLIESFFVGLPAPWNVVARHSVAGAIAFLIITYLHVVFGELIPKSMAIQSPDRFSLWLAAPLTVFAIVTRPLTVLMNLTSTAILKLLGFRATPETHLHSVEELALLIEDTEEAGLLSAEHAEVVLNVFSLRDKLVRDIMVPRERMASLELHMPPEKVLEAVRNSAHTRMPVYDVDPDNIVGIVNTKDLFYLFSLKGVVILADAIYPAIFLPPDEEIATALQLFRKAKRPMALVRDESDKIVGLITLEDIIEEIVGDIEDEHDLPTPRRVGLRRTTKLRRAVQQKAAPPKVESRPQPEKNGPAK